MSYASEVALDSPVGWWRKDDNSGTARDVSGNGFDGTYHNAPILGARGLLIDDADAGVTYSDASSQYVSVPYTATLNPSTFTIECLAKVTSTGTFQAIISSRDGVGNSNNKGYILYYSGDTSAWSFWIGVGGVDWTKCESGVAVGANVTYHLACSYDGSNMRIYVNGLQKGITPTSAFVPNGTYEFRIAAGVNESGPTFFARGMVDEVAVYNKALNGGRIYAHAAAALVAPAYLAQTNTQPVRALR